MRCLLSLSNSLPREKTQPENLLVATVGTGFSATVPCAERWPAPFPRVPLLKRQPLAGYTLYDVGRVSIHLVDVLDRLDDVAGTGVFELVV